MAPDPKGSGAFCISGQESIELPQPYTPGRICPVAIDRPSERSPSTTQQGVIGFDLGR
jgi:hypothetical protein